MAVASELDNDAFAKEFYEPVELRPTITWRKPIDGLAAVDRKKLLAVKKTLTDFLKSFDYENQDPMQFLTVENQNKYVNRTNLYSEKFGAEALLGFEIYDFVIKRNGEEIVIYFSLTETTEGTDTIRQTAIAFTKSIQDWKISRFGKEINHPSVEESE
jgi:hypothetical protein